MIRQQLKDTPEQSDRQIGKALGVSNKTVSTARAEMEQSGQLCNLHTSTGADGKQYPRATKPKTTYVYEDYEEPGARLG